RRGRGVEARGGGGAVRGAPRRPRGPLADALRAGDVRAVVAGGAARLGPPAARFPPPPRPPPPAVTFPALAHRVRVGAVRLQAGAARRIRSRPGAKGRPMTLGLAESRPSRPPFIAPLWHTALLVALFVVLALGGAGFQQQSAARPA